MHLHHCVYTNKKHYDVIKTFFASQRINTSFGSWNYKLFFFLFSTCIRKFLPVDKILIYAPFFNFISLANVQKIKLSEIVFY